MRGPLVASLALAMLVSCVGPRMDRFGDEPVVWEDPDRSPFAEMPEEYWSGLAWDGLDQTVFIPVSRFFAMDFAGLAENVNAFDEVPNSSWFVNRIGLYEMTAEEVAQGSCPENILDTDGPWTITDAKPNGANPGFIIRGPEGRGWLIKFDGRNFSDERATTADVFGSRVYHAAGYWSPCNIVVYFDRSILQIDPDAESEDEEGNEVPMQEHHIDAVLEGAITNEDGLYRASASLFVAGRPLGPWTYQGTRRDDPNDVVRHEDRRELRGGRVLAAWLGHFDAREQNTLTAWIETGDDGEGHVRHYYLDFGDCLGSRWEQDGLSRRFGYSYYFDPAHVAADFFTFGFIPRAWHDVTLSEVAPMLGYWDADHFVPQRWRPGYPNPAFAREQPGDGAWMARIIARMDQPLIEAMLDEGQLSNPLDRAETLRTLMARRQRVLDHYLQIRSPLADFEVDGDTVCFNDLAVQTEVISEQHVSYQSRAWAPAGEEPLWDRFEHHIDVSRPCVEISEEAAELDYLVLDVENIAEPGMDPIPPARVHLTPGDDGWELVGIERPGDASAPRLR